MLSLQITMPTGHTRKLTRSLPKPMVSAGFEHPSEKPASRTCNGSKMIKLELEILSLSFMDHAHARARSRAGWPAVTFNGLTGVISEEAPL
jgi:hypothetical protein